MAAAATTMIPSVQVNHNLNYVFTSFDPTSLILSQFSNINNNSVHHHHHHQSHHHPLQITSQSCFMERGSRYDEYAALRESKLRIKNNNNVVIKQEDQEGHFNLSSSLQSQKKHIKSSSGYLITPATKKPSSSSSKGSSSSIPDFVKKENRRPAMVVEKPTTVSGLRSKSGTYDGILGKMVVGGGGGGGKAAAVEKKNGTGGGGGFMARKSYASLEALKGLGSQARRAINGEGKGMRTTPRRNCNLDKNEFAYSSQF